MSRTRAVTLTLRTAEGRGMVRRMMGSCGVDFRRAGRGISRGRAQRNPRASAQRRARARLFLGSREGGKAEEEGQDGREGGGRAHGYQNG